MRAPDQVYWFWTGDHWLAASKMSDPVASVKKFESGWFYATRIPTFIWSGWSGPFPTDDEAKKLAAPTAIPATADIYPWEFVPKHQGGQG